MKYLSLNLIDEMFNCDLSEEERKEAEHQWEKACSDSFKELLKCEHKLPVNLRNHLHNGFFHDAIIKDVSLIKQRKKISHKFSFDVAISMDWREKRYNLIHSDVTFFKTNITFSNEYIEFGDYLYGEIFMEDAKWNHNFLLFEYSEINIVCKKIIFKEIK